MHKLYALLKTTTHLIFALIQLLILTRFVFKLLGASQTAPFVILIYKLTTPLLAPFRGIFQDIRLDGMFYILEPASFISFLVFLFVGILLGEFFSKLELIADNSELGKKVDGTGFNEIKLRQ